MECSRRVRTSIRIDCGRRRLGAITKQGYERDGRVRRTPGRRCNSITPRQNHDPEPGAARADNVCVLSGAPRRTRSMRPRVGRSVCSAASLGTSRRQLWGNPSRQTNRRQRRIGLRGRWEDTTAPASDDESRRAVRLDTKGVVDGATQLLLAPEVPLRRLDRDVPEEELNLIQFTAGEMTQARTRPS